MAGGHDRRDPPGEAESKRRGKRRRSILNLGLPFVRIDDYVNLGEEAVVLGYKVLQQTIDEIKAAYGDVKAFNEKQKAHEDKPGMPPPEIPWERMVQRAETMQAAWLDATSKGSEIAFDAMKTATRSTRSAARAWERSRTDVDPKPVLAGPVFEHDIRIEVMAGTEPRPLVKTITHRGLARLRINAMVDPAPAHEDDDDVTIQNVAVDFRPVDSQDGDPERISRLDVHLPLIPHDQPPGWYYGLIRASNFNLLIARLLVLVKRPRAAASRETEADDAPDSPPVSPRRSRGTGDQEGRAMAPVRLPRARAGRRPASAGAPARRHR